MGLPESFRITWVGRKGFENKISLPRLIFSFLNLISHAWAARILILLELDSDNKRMKKLSNESYIFDAFRFDFSICAIILIMQSTDCCQAGFFRFSSANRA